MHSSLSHGSCICHHICMHACLVFHNHVHTDAWTRHEPANIILKMDSVCSFLWVSIETNGIVPSLLMRVRLWTVTDKCRHQATTSPVSFTQHLGSTEGFRWGRMVQCVCVYGKGLFLNPPLGLTGVFVKETYTVGFMSGEIKEIKLYTETTKQKSYSFFPSWWTLTSSCCWCGPAVGCLNREKQTSLGHKVVR